MIDNDLEEEAVPGSPKSISMASIKQEGDGQASLHRFARGSTQATEGL